MQSIRDDAVELLANRKGTNILTRINCKGRLINMGAFAAHALEGCLFLFLGIWWAFHVFRMYIQTIAAGHPYRSYLSYHVVIRGKAIPFETIFFKTFCPFIGLVTDLFNEKWTFVDADGSFVHIVGLQHIIIHALFVIHGITELMEYYKLPVIKGLKYFTFALAMIWFSVEFYYHSDPDMHKPPLENQLHRLGIPLTALCGMAIMVEFSHREQIFPQLLRCLCVLCLGTWYLFMANVLFLPTPFPGRKDNPAWDQQDERNVHFIVAAFGLNIIFVLMAMTVSYSVMVICYRRSCFQGFVGRTLKRYPYVPLKGFESDFTQEDSLM